MALPDIPLSNQSENLLDNPDFFPPVPENLEKEEIRNRRLVEAAAIRTVEEGEENFVEAYQHLDMTSKQQRLSATDMRKLETVRAMERVIKLNEEFVNGLIITSPDTAEDAIEALRQANDEVRAEAERSDAAYQVITKQFNDPSIVSEETRNSLAINAQLQDSVLELVASQGIWGLIGDIALDLIPTKMVIDVIQATDSYNPFTWGTVITKLIHKYQVMTPEEKLEAVPVLQQQLLDDGVVKFRVASIITAILDPTKEQRVSNEFGVFAPISGVLDIFVVASLLKMASRAKTVSNIIKLASKSGSTDRAAKLNTTILIDDEEGVAKLVGIDRTTTAINNSTPFNVSAADPAADPSISGAVFNNIVKYRQNLRADLNKLEEGATFIAEPTILEADIPAAVKRIDNIFDDFVFSMAKRGKIISISRVDKTVTPRGVTYDFIYKDIAGTSDDIGRFTRNFVRDDNSFWTTLPKPTGLSKFLLSMKARAAGGLRRVFGGEALETDFLEAVNGAIRLDYADSTVRTQFSKLLLEAVKPITALKFNIKKRTKKIEELAEVLTYGDEVGDAGRVFTAGELRSGVAGHRLDGAQIETYYNIRALLDGVADLRNTRHYNSFIERDVKTIFMDGKAAAFGVVEKSSGEAVKSLAKSGIASIWDSVSGASISISNLGDLEVAYARGKRIVKLEDTILRGNKQHQWAWVDVADIHAPPRQVLHLKIGYVPRINPRAEWFVQLLTETTIDGIPRTHRKAIRGFETELQAKNFRNDYEADISIGAIKTGREPRVVINRESEIEQFRVGTPEGGSAGGLIYGPRKFEALPFGPVEDEIATPRLGAFQSIGLYMENSKNFVTRNEWRMAMRAKWENSARKATGNKKITFEEPDTAQKNATLMEAHAQINEWSGFRSPSEQIWDDIVQSLYEVTVDAKGKPGIVAESIHSMKHKDAAAAIKTATFHALLGGINPAQIIVQSSGAAVAASTNMFRPDKLAAIVYRQNAMFLAGIGDVMEHPAAVKKIAKAFGWKELTFKKHMELWKRTGFEDSTMMSADIAAAQSGFGLTASGWRKAQELSTVGFREGELFNRRISFLTAIEELGGIDKVLGNAGLERAMVTRVSDFLLNLGPANRAWWQKGVWGIPTQFAQIMTKTIETYMGLNGSFNKADRFKLFMTQFALYGTAALPAGAWFARHYMDQTGWTQSEINLPENRAKLALVNGGIFDFLMNSYIGADVTMAERTSLLNSFDQGFMDFFEKETTLYDRVTGPAGGVAKRVWEKIGVMSPWFARYPMPDEFDDLTPQDILDVTMYLLEDAAEVGLSPFSTTRQVIKYRDMTEYNRIMDKNFNMVAGGPAEPEYNTMTRVMILMGAKSNQEDEKQTILQMNQNFDDYVEYKVKSLMHAYMRYWREMQQAQKDNRPLSPRIIKRYNKITRVIEAGISDVNTRRAVRRAFRRKVEGLKQGNSLLERQQQEAYRRYREELSDDVTSSNIKLVPIR